MGGYCGKLLRINLTSGEISTEEIDLDIARKFIGGRGLGTWYLVREIDPQINALSPANKLIIATGPVTGTREPASGRYMVVTKSPLTGTVACSNSGGDWGPELKFAGYDVLILEGKAPQPSTITIRDDEVRIQAAADYWGKLVGETTDALLEAFGDPKARVLVIGPAGERLSPIAAVMNDKYRAAGRSDEMNRMTRSNKMNRMRRLVLHAMIFSCLLFGGAAAILLLLFVPAVSASEAPEFATLLMRGDTCIVRHEGTKKVLFESAEPHRAIEWALSHSRIAVLKSGEFNVSGSVRIPRPSVSLIIAKEATVQPAEKARLDIVSEGHGDYPALIHNKGMDHVAVINLGTLRGCGRGCAGIMYNGRSGGKLGIDGGLVFSAGAMPKSGDAIWLVDSKNLHVPFAADKNYDNNLMAIEGCEDLEIGVVAGLAGSNSGENEAIDLNSYSRRIHIRHMIGASYCEQILDVNNSTDITVDKITGYTGGGKFKGHLVDIINYLPNGRRLTQRPRIAKCENVEIREKGVAEEKIGDWKIAAEVEGDMLKTLPQMRVTVRLIGNPDKEKVTVFEGTYQFDLKATPQKCQSVGWPLPVTVESRPGTYFWCPGSALDRENIEFNLRKMHEAGIGPDQDTLPKRLLSEPIPEGPSKGHVHHLGELLPQYYKERGWSEDGVPTEVRLAELALT